MKLSFNFLFIVFVVFYVFGDTVTTLYAFYNNMGYEANFIIVFFGNVLGFDFALCSLKIMVLCMMVIVVYYNKVLFINEFMIKFILLVGDVIGIIFTFYNFFGILMFYGLI